MNTRSIGFTTVPLTALAVLVVLACQETTPTAPDDALEPIALSAEQSASFTVALDDARLRILPVLAEAPAATSLGDALDGLDAALRSNNRWALARALDQCEAALAALAANTGESAANAAELDAVRLLVVAARPLLEAGPAAAPR